MHHLLDVNVLIALLDPNHAFHERAHAWWSGEVRAWASCPLTENGAIRIMASPNYSRVTRFTVGDLSVTPQSQALVVRFPFGGYVWNRPVALRVERNGQEQVVPILNVTLVMRLAMLGVALVFAGSTLIISALRRRR